MATKRDAIRHGSGKAVRSHEQFRNASYLGEAIYAWRYASSSFTRESRTPIVDIGYGSIPWQMAEAWQMKMLSYNWWSTSHLHHTTYQSV